MSREVVKRVGGRAYRYRIERVRDPVTGRSKAKWTYVGRVHEPGEPIPPRARAQETRERLIDALERALERVSFRELTADAVVTEAGVAHGTFYRYFKDKRAALRAGLDRVKESIDRERPDFDAPVQAREEERQRVRAWVEVVLRAPLERTGLLRAWYEAMPGDPEIRAFREARRAESIGRLASYLERLAKAGVVTAPPDIVALSSSLYLLLESAFRVSAMEGRSLSESEIGGVGAVFDRAIFH